MTTRSFTSWRKLDIDSQSLVDGRSSFAHKRPND
jgi:hypothetical protein